MLAEMLVGACREQAPLPGTQAQGPGTSVIGGDKYQSTDSAGGGRDRPALSAVLPCLGKHHDSPSQSHYHNIDHPSSLIHDPCNYPTSLLTDTPVITHHTAREGYWQTG